jgi:hypothetical protein
MCGISSALASCIWRLPRTTKEEFFSSVEEEEEDTSTPPSLYATMPTEILSRQIGQCVQLWPFPHCMLRAHPMHTHLCAHPNATKGMLVKHMLQATIPTEASWSVAVRLPFSSKFFFDSELVRCLFDRW